MQCPCGGETKPWNNVVKNKKVVAQSAECRGCGRRIVRPVNTKPSPKMMVVADTER